MKNYKNNLKVKITYKYSDDIFIGDLLNMKVLEDNADGTGNEVAITYFDPFSAEGEKTIYYKQNDMLVKSIEISSPANQLFANNLKWKEWA